jgi:hypothetical protein
VPATPTHANARLFLPEGRVQEALEQRGIRRTFETRAIRSSPARAAQRALMKAGLLTYERNALERVVSARRRVLGDAATGPPRFLVRVDEFPHYLAYDRPETYGLEAARAFHEIMASTGVMHLMAVVPQLTRHPLDPDAEGGRSLDADELEHLRRLQDDGVVLAQHGTTHRTRYRDPRRHSELCGLSNDELRRHLDRGLAALAEAGVAAPRVFVPPFNRFDATQWSALAERYAIVCGGPEAVRLLGFQGVPSFRQGTLYLPSYPPFYGTADKLLPAVERTIEAAPGTWVPLVLHLGWEADDGWANLERLAQLMAPYTADWNELLAAVDTSLRD